MKPGVLLHRLLDREDDVRIVRLRLGAVLADRLAVDGQRVLVDELALHQLVDHRRHAAGAMELLAEILAGRLHVDEQGHVVAHLLPLADVELDADVAGDGVDVDRGVGRAADGAVDHDRVLERLPSQDVGRLEVLPHHVDDAPARLVGDLAALAVRRRDRGASRQAHAERLGEGVHRRRRAHGVAMADRRRGGRDDLHELLVIDLALGEVRARLPHDRPRSRALAVMPAVIHRASRQHDRRDVDCRRGHDAGGRRLVAAGGQHDAVDEIAH